MWICSSVPYLSPRQAGQTDAWTDQTARAGHAGSQDLRRVEEVSPPAEVARALGIEDPSQSAIVRSRVIRLDGHPIELADSWYPLSVAAETPLTENRKIKGGAVTLLAALGFAAQKVDEDISVRAADAEEAQMLGITEGEPLIVLFRTVMNAEGVPFEVSMMRMTAAGRHLKYQLTVG